MDYSTMTDEQMITEAANTLATVRRIRAEYDQIRGNGRWVRQHRETMGRQQRKAQRRYGDICDELMRRGIADRFDAEYVSAK